MNNTTTMLALLFGALATSNALAQQAIDCPRLPLSADMHWESRVTGDTAFCRALLADGSEAFGLYISSEPGFRPRDPNRLEQGSLNGQAVLWYRSEIAAAPGIQAREATLELPDGRYMHAWLQADSNRAIATYLSVLSGLRFGTNPVASGQ